MKYIDVSTLTAQPFSRVFSAGRKLAILFTVATCLPALVMAQTSGSWTLADIAAKALEADPAVRSSRALAGIASTQYELELDRARPKLGLALTPLAWDDRRIFDFTSTPPGIKDSSSLSLGGGLNLNQALPTAGVLSAGAKTLFKVTDPTADIGYALTPSLSAGLRQPLWAGGQLLPFAAADATKRSAQITASQAALDDLARRNQAVRAAVESAGRVLVLRKNLAVQQAFLNAALGRAEALSLRRSAGTATEDAALELALNAELARQSLLDTRLALQDAQRRLASVLGFEVGATTGLLSGAQLPPLSEVLPKLAPAMVPGSGDAPDVARAALGVEKALADAAARATVDAPVLGASLLVEPRYRDERPDSSSLTSAFSDFFDYSNNAGVNWNLSLSLDIPLTASAARQYRTRLDSLALEAAEAQRTQTQRAVGDRAAALAERRDALGERLDIQRRIAALEARKADRLDDLAKAGIVPREDATDARAALDRDLAEILRLELDLLLTELDLRSLAGVDLATAIASGY